MFRICEGGVSHIAAEGRATLERSEGSLSQSVGSPSTMAGVWTEDSIRGYDDGMEAATPPTVVGQFGDADTHH